MAIKTRGKNLPASVVARYSGCQRNLKCSICNRTFCYDKNLVKHMKVHANASAKSCDTKMFDSSARNVSSLKGEIISTKRVDLEMPKLTRHIEDGALPPVVVEKANSAVNELVAHTTNAVEMSSKKDQLCSSHFQNNIGDNAKGFSEGQLLNDSSNETNVRTVLEGSKDQSVHMVDITASSAPMVVPAKENLKADTSSLPSVHPEVPTASSEPSPLLCDFCGRSFSNPGNFQQHRIIHTGEKPFKCYYCKSSFFAHAVWKEHLASHSKSNRKQEEYIQLKEIHPLSNSKTTFHSSSLATSHCTADTETVVMKVNLDLNDKTVTNDNTITATEMANVRSGRLEQLIEALTKEVAQSSVDIPGKKNQAGSCSSTMPVKNAIKNLVILQAKSESAGGTDSKKELSDKTPLSPKQYQCHFCPRSFPRARHLTNHEKIHTRGKQNPPHRNSPVNSLTQVTLESTCDTKSLLLSGEESVVKSSMKTTDNVIQVITQNKKQIPGEVHDQFHPGVTMQQTGQQWPCDVCNKQCINESHLWQHQKIHAKHKRIGDQHSTLIVHQSPLSSKDLSGRQETTDDNPATILSFLQSSEANINRTFVANENACCICRKRLNCVSIENRVQGSPTNMLCTACLHTDQIFDKKDHPQVLKYLNKSEILTAGYDSGKDIDKARRIKLSRKYDKSWFYVSKLKITNSIQTSQNFPFFCKICRKKFLNKSTFTRHSQHHPTSKLNTFKLHNQYKYSFRWNEWLAARHKHIYTCPHCNKSLKSFGGFILHQTSHRTEFFVCGQCNLKFFLKNSLKYHSLKCGKDSFLGSSDFSSVELTNPPDQGVIKSPTEEGKSITIEKLDQTEVEVPVVKWQCNVCEDRFNQAFQLFQHYQTDHTELLGPFHCPFCKQLCQNAEEALRHLSSHGDTDSNAKVSQIDNISNLQIIADNLSCSLHSDLVFNIFEKSLQSTEYVKIPLQSQSATSLPVQLKSADDDVSVAVKDQSTLNHGIFPQQNNLEQHLQVLQNGEKLYRCEFCSKNFNHADKLQAHHCLYVKERSYKCPHCDKSFSQINVYKRHVQQTHGLSYQCKVCSRCYNSSSDLVQHQKESSHHPNASCNLSPAKHSSSPYTYKCSVCQKVVRNLKIHMRIHDPNPDTVYRCNVCPKTFLQSGNLKQHLMMHSGERPLRCEFCDKGFIHSSHLKRHRQTHTGERPHQCEYCQRTFAERAKLRMHLRTHTKEKPYACHYKGCGKSFSLKSVLDAHQLLHTGERPHTCEDCDRSFTQRCNLIAHRRIHTGERPFKCKICHCAFRNSSNLKDHERLHSDEKPFKCHLCSKVFKRSDYLGKHLLIHSNNKRGVRNRGKGKSGSQCAERQSKILMVTAESPKGSYLPSQITANLTCNYSPPKVKENVQLPSSFAVTSIENVGFEQLIKTFSQEAAEASVDLLSGSVLDDHSDCGTVENVIEIYTEQDSVSVQMSEDNISELTSPMVEPQVVSSGQASDLYGVERYLQCHLCSKSFDNAQMLGSHVQLHFQEKGESQVDIAQQTEIERTPEKSAVIVENPREPGSDMKKAVSEDLHAGTTERLMCQPVSDEQSEISHEILAHLSELMYYLADYVKGDLEFQLIGNGSSLYLNSIRQTLKPLEGDKLELDAKSNATMVTLIEFQTQPEEQSLPIVGSGLFACLLCLLGSPTVGTFAEHICKHLSELGWTSAESLVTETDSPLADSKKLSEVKNIMDQNSSSPSKNAILSTTGNVPLLDQEFIPVSQFGTNDPKQNVVTLMTTDNSDVSHLSRTCDPNNIVITTQQEIHHVENVNNSHGKTRSPSSPEDLLKYFVEKPNLKATEGTAKLGNLMTGFFQDSDNDVLGSKDNLSQEKFPTAIEAEELFAVEQKDMCQIDTSLQSNRNGNIKKTQSLLSAHSLDSSNTFEICLECKPGEKPFKCGICKKTFKKLKYVKDHIKLHVGKTSLACEICGKVFRRAYNLKKHYKIHQSTPNDDQPATISLNAITKEDDPPNNQNKQNWCNGQPMKKSQDTLLDGQAPKLFTCDICSKTFQLQVYLKQHMKTHTSAKPYVCDHCEMAFSHRAYLTKHRRVHTGEKPYKCSYCDKGFARSELLTRHTRTHTKEKPYSCPHCSQAFALYNTLKRHLRTHTGQKPFECSVCGQAFTQRGNLSIHMRLHTGERPFKCDKCQAGFIHSSNLKKHLKSCNQNN